jgi:indole-3-glycerol phosphate synthase
MYLEKIIQYKKQEVANRKALYSSKLLEQSIYFDSPVVSMKAFLQREDKQGVIAEFKRKSPSKGAINLYASVEEVSLGYMQAGSAALSVLTDTEFFGGKYADLTEARKFNYAPILNKNFIVDEYQILEAKSVGADVILLIAECLEKEKLQAFAKTAKSLGLEVLMEIHSAGQLDKLSDDIDLVGINNRNLKTFEVDIENSFRIGNQIPSDFLKVAESGINDPQTVVDFKKEGFDGFLIGECFMREADPGLACRRFHQTLDALVKLQLQKVVV